MHLADYLPGFVWLYHAPGSGVCGGSLAGGAWWRATWVDAILRIVPMARVIAHIHAVAAGDTRPACYRAYLQWRVAFGRQRWNAVLAGAAAGN